jgi:protein involved in polysaccharide export with SLBB domain
MKLQGSLYKKTARMLSNKAGDADSNKGIRYSLSELASILPRAVAILLLLSLPASTLRAFNGDDTAARRTTTGADYHLGSLDKLRIKISAWRPATAEVFSWEELDGEYSISAAGTLSLPLLGEVPAAGATTAELAREIADRLKERIGLAQSPDASVEVIQFRPFYVVGYVQHPGEYPYRPGMNVLQAMTIAGGQRFADIGAPRLEREVIATTGELNQLEAERINLLARKARLESELKDLDTFQFPPTVADARNAAFISIATAQERLIFNARQDGYKTQLRALGQLHDYLEKEVTSIEGQINSHHTEVGLIRQELESIRSLAGKGLATEPRRLGLERNFAEAEGSGLRLESELLRVKQAISRCDIDILQLRNQRTNDATVELALVGNKLEEIGRKLETAEKLIYESEVIAPRFLADRLRKSRTQIIYTIVRRNGGTVSELTASETTTVEPGDTVKVEMLSPPPDEPMAQTSQEFPAESPPGTQSMPKSTPSFVDARTVQEQIQQRKSLPR